MEEWKGDLMDFPKEKLQRADHCQGQCYEGACSICDSATYNATLNKRSCWDMPGSEAYYAAILREAKSVRLGPELFIAPKTPSIKHLKVKKLDRPAPQGCSADYIGKKLCDKKLSSGDKCYADPFRPLVICPECYGNLGYEKKFCYPMNTKKMWKTSDRKEWIETEIG